MGTVVLDGVGQQIQQNLAQASSVGQHAQGRRSDLQLKIQARRFGLGTDHFGTFAHQPVDLQDTHLQARGLGLQTRPVQQVIDQMGQVLAGREDFIQGLGVLLIIGRLQTQQLGKPVNGVQRCAQFVAHAGDEARLGLADALRLQGAPA